jgi:DNA polymerase III epsilon subunit-like protein
VSSPKDKPRGYFEFLLAIDCETTGLNFTTDDASVGHQAVSWGVIVADAKTLKPIDELYVEIKWNEQSRATKAENPKFGLDAEKVHGLTFDYLEQNGIDESEAVLLIGSLIMKYWGPTVSIRTLGHNVHLFDLPFLRAMFRRHDIELSFGNRHYDTNSIGFVAFDTFNSDDLFEKVGFDTRGTHNALDDARMALESARRIRVLFQNAIEEF